MPTFTPPVRYQAVGGHDRLWAPVRFGIGETVVKFGTGYQTLVNPTSEALVGADQLYLGGRTYEITVEEATALTAAGYGAGVAE